MIIPARLVAVLVVASGMTGRLLAPVLIGGAIASPPLGIMLGMGSAANNLSQGNYHEALKDAVYTLLPFARICGPGMIPMAGRTLLGGAIATEGTEAYASYLNGDKGGVFEHLAAAAGFTLQWFGSTCFAAGTPLRTPEGSKSIEEFREGDWILSRDEDDPEAPLEAKRVVRIFRRTGQVFHLHVGGQVIRTTGEHPFFVRSGGWIPCNEMRIGMELLSADGHWLPVEDLLDTGEWENVYNLTVDGNHTYFVGCDRWGFDVWAHNFDCDLHHTIPREIREPRSGKPGLLPSHLKDRPDIVGRPGLPNRWSIPRDKHREIHDKKNDTEYNNRWKDEIGDLRARKPDDADWTEKDILDIRDRLVIEFEIEIYRPKKK